MDISTENILNSLESKLVTWEKTLDFAGRVPIVSFFSGATRVAYGTYEMFFSFLGILGFAVEAIITHSERAIQDTFRSLGYIPHGFSNIGRGTLEMIQVIMPVYYVLTPFFGSISRHQYQVEKRI